MSPFFACKNIVAAYLLTPECCTYYITLWKFIASLLNLKMLKGPTGALNNESPFTSSIVVKSIGFLATGIYKTIFPYVFEK